ncbi:MAG: metallophosphoesterase family protein [Dehalococcoidia bacterium]|nr:metallophosphoesterase family protein [Dehalococcoidia bacterium]
MKEDTGSLLNEVEKLFEQEGNLVRLESGRVVFVGDTHGDLEATQRVLDKYLGANCKIVFLGDYVDRGPESVENLNVLLRTKIEVPENIFLLMGNHEGYKTVPFSPADFWEGLDREWRQRYAAVLSMLPLAVSTSNGIVALHGALPYVQALEDISSIQFGSREWQQVTWGDWRENEASDLDDHTVTGRPQFGQKWFEEIMRRLGKNVLIRSHQPDIAPVIYDRRCLTIFTSSVYRALVPKRTVAIADLEKEIRTVDDLEIETI